MSEPTEKPERRIAILGTASTWKSCPFDDPSLEIWHLNDAWVLKPPRVDRWFDLHPFDRMYFRKPNEKVNVANVPAGFFVRPQGHVEWLRSQTIPVYVQDAAQLGTPSAVTFPRDRVVAAFGDQFASSPAWMLGLAMLEGATEIHIYGIHLATEWEYVKQKPNLSFLLGIAAGRGIKIVIPKGAPLLKETHQYAYEDDPDTGTVRLKYQLKGLQQQLAIVQAQAKRKWYQRPDPNAISRMAWLQAQIADTQLAMQHVMAGQVPAGY